MTTLTADDFRTARFATHPDGRIAARVDPGDDGYPWVMSGDAEHDWDWYTDEGMAADGWSPLDETRLPRVVTDEKVRAVAEEMWMHSEEPGTWDEASEDWLALARVALSAAPTTDDAGIGPETRAAYRDLHTPTTDEDDRATLTDGIDFAALWKQERADFQKVTRELIETKARADNAEKGLADLSERYREQGGALLRAESLTAREHLDAVDLSGVVRVVVVGPGGTEYERGDLYSNGARIVVQDFGHTLKVFPVDPPTPTRPEGAEALKHPVIQSLAGMDSTRVHGLTQEDIEGLCDRLAERGVRAPEDGEER